jgi:hypothetical protein
MSEALLTQRQLSRVIGQTRLRRLLRAGWLSPVGRSGQAILFDPRDVHAALRRLERSDCPPDRLEITRVRASEARNGYPRVRKENVTHPVADLNAIEIDFSSLEPNTLNVQPFVPSGPEIKPSTVRF